MSSIQAALHDPICSAAWIFFSEGAPKSFLDKWVFLLMNELILKDTAIQIKNIVYKKL